ncbi:hypothetical protein GA0070562_3955 [Micromonospora tulbaghiae]|uniref:Uncharacterized protein n=1 Tax=Micromonospora tulbaghiae TaxID=479978 RepID=A0ABY0KMI0_9ACTN|nr:hypothetical protein MicB006_3704 [Micromonospora sp. B006]SCE90111.1 hypothetical protein GA0070562_3955 [Micromonospora tulbaghiae]
MVRRVIIKRANRRRGSTSRWPLFAPAVAVGLLVLGLTLNAVTVLYDLTHWDVVYHVSPEEAANRNGLADLRAEVVGRLTVVLSGLAMAGLLLSLVGLVRGRAWAHTMTCILTIPMALCCGQAFIANRGSFAGSPDNPNAPQHTSAPSGIRLADSLGPPLLVGAAIVVLILLFLPAIYRRFHPTKTT